MRLRDIINEIDYELVKGSLDTDIQDVKFNSKEVEQGDIFVAIKGTVTDSHTFIPDAIRRGAQVIVVERDVEILEEVTVLKVPSSRRALALLSRAYFGYPEKELITIGITGTCGKTTTSFIVKAMLDKAGMKTGIIGSIQADVGGEIIEVHNTTPESYEIQMYMRKMVENGCKAVVMEVSSQGIKMDRVAGIEYSYGIFTNLSPDHIGPNEHADFKEYLSFKRELFKNCKIGIFNADDEHCEEILQGATCEIIRFGETAGSLDLMASNIQYVSEEDFLGISFDVKGKVEGTFRTCIPGNFSVYNSLCAISVCSALNIDVITMQEALEKIQVRGRMEVVSANATYKLIIDYAHNERECECLKETIMSYNPKRVVCVFGSGGDRPRDRRFAYGEMAGDLADLSVVTEDNSRFEPIDDIIKDILVGLARVNGKYIIVKDRKDAIRYAIENAQEGDYILLIGKGHETYREIRGVRYPFDEVKIVKEIEEELGI